MLTGSEIEIVIDANTVSRISRSRRISTVSGRIAQIDVEWLTDGAKNISCTLTFLVELRKSFVLLENLKNVVVFLLHQIRDRMTEAVKSSVMITFRNISCSGCSR